MTTVGALLLEPNSGLVKLHVAEYHDWDTAEFMWTDGNYACDCNRTIFLTEDHETNWACTSPAGSDNYRIQLLYLTRK